MLELTHTSPRPSRWIMSTAHFHEVASEIRTIWAATPSQAPFFQKLKRITRFYRRFCIQRAQAYRAEEEALYCRLNQMNNALQTDPLSTQLQQEVSNLKTILSRFETCKLEGQKI